MKQKENYIQPKMLLFRVETKRRLLIVSEKNVSYDPTDGTSEALSKEYRWGGSAANRGSRSVWDSMEE